MTQQEVIKAFMHSLDETEMSGRAALDEAVRASSDFKNFQEVVEKFTADGEAAYPEGSSFTVNGLTIYGIPPRETLTEAQQLVVRGLYSWWIRDSLELVEKSYGMSYTEAGTTNSRLLLKFIDDSSSSVLAYVSFGSADKSYKEWESQILCVNMHYFRNITADDRHGYVAEFDDYLDRTLVHELTHGVMASNINYFYNLPGFLREGGSAELVHGIDDMRNENLIEYAKNPDTVVNILSLQYSESNAPYEIYAGGYLFMRYFYSLIIISTT